MDKLKQLFDSGKIFEFSSEDENEFYQFLDNSQDIDFYAFENNWPYIIQATRNGRYIFYFKESVVYFSLRFKKNSKENYVVVVNFLGKNRKEAVLEFSTILKGHNIDVLIKNIDKKELGYWEKRGFIESTKPWSEYAYRDDNTFPLYIISSETIKKREFNRDYKRLFKKFDGRNLITEPYDSMNNEITESILRNNATFLSQKGVDEKEEVVRGHQFFFDDSLNNKIKLQHIKEDEIIGASYLTKVNDVAFYNALFCNKEEDLMKYLLYCGMQYVVDRFPTVSFFSIQGSENEGQDFFKSRYYPSYSIEKTHIVFKNTK